MAHDTYCIFCGGPFYYDEIITDTKLLNKYLKDGKYRGVNPSGLWETAESVVEYLEERNDMPEKDHEKLQESIFLIKKHFWLSDVVALTPENKLIHGITYTASQFERFVDENDNEYTVDKPRKKNDKKVSYMTHYSCIILLLKKKI